MDINDVRSIEEAFVRDGGEVVTKKSGAGIVVVMNMGYAAIPLNAFGKARGLDAALKLAVNDLADLVWFGVELTSGARKRLRRTLKAMARVYG